MYTETIIWQVYSQNFMKIHEENRNWRRWYATHTNTAQLRIAGLASQAALAQLARVDSVKEQNYRKHLSTRIVDQA